MKITEKIVQNSRQVKICLFCCLIYIHTKCLIIMSSYLYSRPPEFSFLHGAYCPIMQYTPCRNWKILTVVSISLPADRKVKTTRRTVVYHSDLYDRLAPSITDHITHTELGSDKILQPCRFQLLAQAVYVDSQGIVVNKAVGLPQLLHQPLPAYHLAFAFHQ